MSLLLLLFACSDEPVPEPNASSRLLSVLDANADGLLSQAEFERVAHPDQDFSSADLNGDQSVDSDELRELLMRESPLLENHRGSDEDRGRVQ